MLYLTVGKAGGALVGHIHLFKSQALTGGDGQRAQALLGKYNYENEEIICTSIRNIMKLKLEDGKDPETPFFEANYLSFQEMAKHHRETISDRGRTFQDVIIRAIPNNSSYVKFAVHRDCSFSKSTIRNVYLAAERDERERVSIGSRKTVVVAERGSRGRKIG